MWFALGDIIEDASLRSASVKGNKGVVPRHLRPSSALRRLGLRPHDLIASVNQFGIHSGRDLLEEIKSSEGRNATLLILRNRRWYRLIVRISST